MFSSRPLLAAVLWLVAAPFTATADIVWQRYDATGTSAANAGTYSAHNGGIAIAEAAAVSFTVPPNGKVTLFTRDFAPIVLANSGDSFRLQFRFSATVGLAGDFGTTRIFHFGLFNDSGVTDSLFSATGPMVRWHHSNQAFEARVRLSGDTTGNLMAGGVSPGTAPYGDQMGAAANGTTYDLAMNVANANGLIALPAGNGVEMAAPGLFRSVRTNPYDIGVTSFNLFAFFFENRTAETVTITLSEFNLTGLTIPDPDAPPAFTRQPVGAEVIVGQEVRLSAAVSGPPPLDLQWLKDDEPVDGATSAELVIAEASLSDAGRYQLRATNPGGTVYSDEVIVAVSAPPVSDMAVVALWPVAGSNGINPDSPLKVTYDRAPGVRTLGRVRVLDTADASVVTEIDLTAAFLTPPNNPGVTLPWPAVIRSVGGYGSAQNVYPVTVVGHTATFHLPYGALDYGRTYQVIVEPGVIGDGPLAIQAGIGAGAAWTFSTRTEAPSLGATITVAADGSGDFSTIQGAIDALPATLTEPREILIRAGSYAELIYTGRNRRFLTLRGESRTGTIIAYPNNNNLNPGSGTRPMVILDADDITLANLTLRNTTPKGGSQAEALRTNRDRTLIQGVDLYSFQDTVLVNTGSAFFDQCLIEGDVDYLWGGGAVFLFRCELRTVFAGYLVQARNSLGSRGFVFVDCRLTRGANLAPQTLYLGRVDPSAYPGSETVFIDCAMEDQVRTVGWQINGSSPGSQLIWAEYRSTDLDGVLLDVSSRLAASRQFTSEQAATYRDPAFVLGGWNPTRTPIAPVVTRTAEPVAVIAGATVSLRPLTLASPSASFQWLRDGQPVAGATAEFLHLPATRLADGGAYALVVTDTAGTVTSPPVAVSVVPGGDYASWLDTHFTPAERLDPAISGPLADPDGDGLVNAAEFALLRDPRHPDSRPLIELEDRDDALTLRWRRAAVAPGFTFQVESRTALNQAWLPAAGIATPLGADLWEHAIPSGDLTNLFARLRVDLP